jgi:hypothetical protein
VSAPQKRAILIAEKTDVAGRHIRQIELCPQHCEVVTERERKRAARPPEGASSLLCCK